MTGDLRDKVILVTGAAQGIGAAVAQACAEAGATLMMSDRNRIDPLPAMADCVPGDLADPDVPARIVAQTIARFGRIDGLVNAAGLTTRGGMADGTLATWDMLFAVNARAPFLLMQAALAAMCQRQTRGSIVNVQSYNAHCGPPDLAIYSASKAALATLTRSAANTHLADGIRVNGINLGWVATEGEHQTRAVVLGEGEDWHRRAAATLPLGRMITPGDCARLAVYLLSDVSAPLTGAGLDLEQRVLGAA